MRIAYTPEQIEFLRSRYQDLYARELTDEFNARFGTTRTVTAIKSKLARTGIHTEPKKRQRKGPQNRLLTPAQEQFLRTTYQTYAISSTTFMLNEEFDTWITIKQIRAFLKNHKITCGRTGQFSRDGRPWNAGTKGVMKPNRTSFKPGPRPDLRNPYGHERIDKDGVILVRVAETNPYTGRPWRYKPKARVVWEQHTGRKVPPDHVIGYLDGNNQNCEFSNLMCLTRAEHIHLHNRLQFDDAPLEVRRSLVMLAKIECGVRLKEKAA